MVMETLITGVTGTIGRATGLEIAKSRATVLLLARNSNKSEQSRKGFIGNSTIDNKLICLFMAVVVCQLIQKLINL